MNWLVRDFGIFKEGKFEEQQSLQSDGSILVEVTNPVWASEFRRRRERSKSD